MNTIVQLFDLLSKNEKFQLIGLFLLFILRAFIEMAGVASIMPFMVVVINPEHIFTNSWLSYFYNLLNFNNEKSYLIFLGICVLTMLIISNLFKALVVWITLKYDNHLNYTISKRLLQSYMLRPYIFFLDQNTSNLGKNILAEVRTVIAGVLSPFAKIISNILLILFIMTLLIIVNPMIAIIMVTILGGSYSLLFYAARNKLSTIGVNQVYANSMKYKTASEALSGIKDIKILNREVFFLERYANFANLHARNNVTAGTISQVPRYFFEIIAFGGILLLVLYFLRTGSGASQMIPLLSLYAFAAYRLMPALQEAFSAISTMRYSVPSLKIVHRDIFNSKWKLPKIFHQSKQNFSPLSFKSSLQLNNVSYQYPNAKDFAVKDLSISVQPFTKIGFVGSTGSGKTTTVDIILGLLSPHSGNLTVDGVAINEFNLSQWQLNLGYVPQHIYLSDDTITRNIAFGVPDSDIDMEFVFQAARIANLDKFIENDLENGYDTIVGERGIRLSGGQRQRIGIARAMYRDPSILIFDEATSALDGVTEERVMSSIRALAGKKTILIIAHRLTTVKDCDVIYLLKDGRIIEAGNFEQLRSVSTWFRAAAKTGS